MTDLELKKLEEDLWHSADLLRAGAHMSATNYGEPILGLIFLRYADIRYKEFKDDIEQEYNKYKGTRIEKSLKDISIEKCGFYLPECAYFDFINEAPDDANKAILVKNAIILLPNILAVNGFFSVTNLEPITIFAFPSSISFTKFFKYLAWCCPSPSNCIAIS